VKEIKNPRQLLMAAKEVIPLLAGPPEENKINEFWNIWMESIPAQTELTDGLIKFELAVSPLMDKLSWRCCGPQNFFIQRMVDFFWNVGAPESEIDHLNNVGADINPTVIGSWIDMSQQGGMDGGWFFPGDVQILTASLAADPSDAVEKVKGWCLENGVSKGNLVGRDMGAAPPRQTEIRFVLPGESFDAQLGKAESAYSCFGLPFPPKEATQILKPNSSGGLTLSVVTSSEGFVRIGLLFPKPQAQVVASLCSMSNAPASNHVQFQQTLHVDGPEWVELQFLGAGFGYGVYEEGFGVIFHYLVGIEYP